MRQPWAALLGMAGVWCAVVLQATGVARVDIFGARPELVWVVALSFAVFSRPASGAALGFLGGWLWGAASGATLTQYAVLGALAGYGVASLGREETDVRTGALMVVVGTLALGIVLIVLAPQPDVIGSARVTMTAAILNGVVAVPVVAAVRRLYRPRVV